MKEPTAPERRAVVQIGAWPPPIGGVAMYVRRLSLLLRDHGWRVTVIDVFGEPKSFPPGIDGFVFRGSITRRASHVAWRVVRAPRDSLVHIHMSAFGKLSLLLPVLPPLFRLRPVILSIHGGGFVGWSKQLSSRRRRSLRRVLEAAERVVVVNEAQRQEVIDHVRIPGEHVRVVPPFLLEREAEPAAMPDLPPGDAPLALVSGIGQPIYWWEGVLEAAMRLGPKLRWTLSAYNKRLPSYFEEVERRATSMSNVVLVSDLDTAAFQTLLAACDLFVRPTLVDGDSIALREALAAGKPVVALDAVRRPEGVTLFRSQDVDDLVRALLEVTSQRSVGRAGTTSDFSEEILSVYADVTARNR